MIVNLRRLHRPASRAIARGCALVCAIVCALLQSCGQNSGPGLIPESDLSPPLVVSAAVQGENCFSLVFSEDIRRIDDSYFLEPGPKKAMAIVDGRKLELLFDDAFSPGEDYRVTGEVEDAKGNSTRFVFAFTGWNARPAMMLLSEVQTGKNSSKTSPHRDYVEFLVTAPGNLGGMEVAWSSSVKRCEFEFPGQEVASGDYLVLHLAPEGLPEEKDERGSDLSLSGGIDANPGARDFWCAAGALPDENGALRISDRRGGAVLDELFYASLDRSGAMKADKLTALLEEGTSAWKLSGPPVWEDAFRRKPSPSHSMARKDWPTAGTEASIGPQAWYVCDTGAQSPGYANIPADPEGRGG